jgi:hypothetical protein
MPSVRVRRIPSRALNLNNLTNGLLTRGRMDAIRTRLNRKTGLRILSILLEELSSFSQLIRVSFEQSN